MAEVHANKMITRGTFYRAWCGAYLELEWGEGEGSVGLKASERDAYLKEDCRYYVLLEIGVGGGGGGSEAKALPKPASSPPSLSTYSQAKFTTNADFLWYILFKTRNIHILF